MSRLSRDKDTVTDAAVQLVRAGAHQIAAATSATAAAITVTYTTDQPAFTANNAITIADGDAVTAAEALEFCREIHNQFNLQKTDNAALYASMEAFRLYGIRSATAAVVPQTGLGSAIAVTYTTDAVAFTANNAVTVADGDATTGAQIVEAGRELSAELVKQAADFGAMVARYNALVLGQTEKLMALGQCPALTAASNPIAWTFTTDNPSISPNAALTITDGDASESPPTQRFEYMYELDDQVTKSIADITAMRTTLNLLLKQAGINP